MVRPRHVPTESTIGPREAGGFRHTVRARGTPCVARNSSMMRWTAYGRTASVTWATSTGCRLPKIKPGPAVNPLTGDVHVIIVGAKSRVNFPTPNTEDVVRYVLHRVR